jgi:hypothetical protein
VLAAGGVYFHADVRTLFGQGDSWTCLNCIFVVFVYLMLMAFFSLQIQIQLIATIFGLEQPILPSEKA